MKLLNINILCSIDCVNTSIYFHISVIRIQLLISLQIKGATLEI